MNLRDQLCDPVLGERLKELGVPQDSMWYWSVPEKRWVYHIDRKSTYIYVSGKRYDVNYVSLFTVAELGEKLPGKLEYSVKEGERPEENDGWLDFIKHDELDKWSCRYIRMYCFDGTEADTRARMYAHLIEKGIVKI